MKKKILFIMMLIIASCTKQQTIEPEPIITTQDYEEKGTWYQLGGQWGDYRLIVTKDTLYELHSYPNGDTSYFTSHYSWIHTDSINVTVMKKSFYFKAISDTKLKYSSQIWTK
jgi:hypothetical protein